MTQAVEDGATRPVYYESRVIKLKLDETTLRGANMFEQTNWQFELGEYIR